MGQHSTGATFPAHSHGDIFQDLSCTQPWWYFSGPFLHTAMVIFFRTFPAYSHGDIFQDLSCTQPWWYFSGPFLHSAMVIFFRTFPAHSHGDIFQDPETKALVYRPRFSPRHCRKTDSGVTIGHCLVSDKNPACAILNQQNPDTVVRQTLASLSDTVLCLIGTQHALFSTNRRHCPMVNSNSAPISKWIGAMMGVVSGMNRSTIQGFHGISWWVLARLISRARSSIEITTNCKCVCKNVSLLLLKANLKQTWLPRSYISSLKSQLALVHSV